MFCMEAEFDFISLLLLVENPLDLELCPRFLPHLNTVQKVQKEVREKQREYEH